MKNFKKNIFIVLIAALFIFSYLWTEGFGISPRYEYGNTIESALNFWYLRGTSITGLSKIISTVDVNQNEKLVFYETKNNTMMVGLVKKKWNYKWMVIGKGGEISFDYSDMQQYNSLKSEPILNWQWANLNEIGLTFGIVYDPTVETITVGGKNASLLNKDTNRCIWYFVTNSNYVNGDLKPILDIKAYEKSNRLVYSFYNQK